MTVTGSRTRGAPTSHRRDGEVEERRDFFGQRRRRAGRRRELAAAASIAGELGRKHTLASREF